MPFLSHCAALSCSMVVVVWLQLVECGWCGMRNTHSWRRPAHQRLGSPGMPSA